MAGGQVRPKKRFGQNFIRDMNLVAKIVRLSGAGSGDPVLEIGPGEGALTQALLDAGCRVMAVEIDNDLIPVLEARFKGNPGFKLVHADILDQDLEGLLRGFVGPGGKCRVVANLPYYITTPILFKLLEEGVGTIGSITVMVQKEVAERMVAPPGGKDYGSLSVAIQYHAVPSIRMHVPPTVFHPRPDVDSAIIHLDMKVDKGIDIPDEGFFFNVVKAAFAQRRKTLRNTLLSAFKAEAGTEGVEAALESAGIEQGRRGETLSLQEFAAVTRGLWKAMGK